MPFVRTVAILLVAAGCASPQADGYDDDGESVPWGCETTDTPIGLEVGDCAPDFELPDQDGRLVDLYGFRGHLVALSFEGLF